MRSNTSNADFPVANVTLNLYQVLVKLIKGTCKFCTDINDPFHFAGNSSEYSLIKFIAKKVWTCQNNVEEKWTAFN